VYKSQKKNESSIACRLDYCNSLLYMHGVTENVMKRVQSLQNAAARLISGAMDVVTTLRRCCVSCTGFLFGGEWSSDSPVWCARHCTANAYTYLADDVHLVSEGNRRSLRSSSDNMCAVPRTHNSFGDRSFGAAGPRIWNSLPCGLRTLDISYKHFKTLPPKHICLTRPRRFVTFYISALEILLLTYLLTYWDHDVVHHLSVRLCANVSFFRQTTKRALHGLSRITYCDSQADI